MREGAHTGFWGLSVNLFSMPISGTVQQQGLAEVDAWIEDGKSADADKDKMKETDNG